ncbi:hypothetical protein TNCV_3629031 [Trichonephila clavipes]|nr:hypothetical protein TNCV_3629031 [Trichonephila clavipes]
MTYAKPQPFGAVPWRSLLSRNCQEQFPVIESNVTNMWPRYTKKLFPNAPRSIQRTNVLGMRVSVTR